MLQHEPIEQEAQALKFHPVNEVDDQDLRPILKNLESQDTVIRATAEAKVTAYIRRNVRTIEMCRQLRRGLALLNLIVVGSMLWHRLVLGMHIDDITLFVQMEWSVLYFAGIGVAHNAGNRLALINSVRAIPPLLDVIAAGGFTYSSPLHVALLRLIPLLTASDYDLIDSRQRIYLLRLLRMRVPWFMPGRSWFNNLKIAILKALEQVGDENAIPVVQHLAANSKNVKVRNAAIECLPFLQQKSLQVTPGRTLLRAAAQSEVEATLLRAANENQDQPSIELLRAAADRPAT
jgi:hypothetical protein